MTRHRAGRLPDAPWLVVAVVVIFVAGLIGIALAGPDDQRFAREREPDPLRPVAVKAGTGPAPSGPAVPPEVAAARDEWPLPHHDYANTRATTTAEINSSNVGQLGVVWFKELSGAGNWGAAASGPLIADGVVYFQDLTSDVYALDLVTGKDLWVRRFNQAAFGPNGPALGYGKVYAHDGNHKIAALDLKTGRVFWRTSLAGPTGQQQPTAFGGFVYTGIAAGRRARGPGDAPKTRLLAPGSSGFAYGLDHKDGRVVWEFQTVEKGFWGDPNLNAGAGIWMTAGIDVGTGTTYWSTGNPVPAPGTWRNPNAQSRPGPNLYSNTMLALDGRTGELRWYNQVLPHDLFHHDFQNPPVLAQAGGKKLVIGTGKMGIVYAIDRASGELVWKTPVGTHQNDELQRLPLGKVVTVYPGFWGGNETPASLADGVLYVLTVNMPTPYTATAWGARDGEHAVHNLEGRTKYADGTSEVDALDVATGKIKWTRKLPAVGFAATTVVNDLVFTATYDGKIYALSRSDGRIAWTYQAPGGIIAWPAVAADTIIWPVGLGRNPMLLALRLGAKLPVAQPRARPQAPPPPK